MTHTCPRCGGEGTLTNVLDAVMNPPVARFTCPTCNGTGVIDPNESNQPKN